MANATDPLARSVHGTDPQYLVDKITRTKIYDTMYWKDKCFGLNAESILDRAVELDAVGGTYGATKSVSQFLCLVLKSMQTCDHEHCTFELVKNREYKYVRVLGAFYLRLVGRPADIYTYIEPLYEDFRKVRFRNASGQFEALHIDELADDLLHMNCVFGIMLPRLPARFLLEEANYLERRVSPMQAEFEKRLVETEGRTTEQVSG